MNHPTTIAVDLSKSVFEVAVSFKAGRIATEHAIEVEEDQETRVLRQRENLITLVHRATGHAVPRDLRLH